MPVLLLPPATPLEFAARTTGIALASGDLLVVGWAFAETTNAAGAALEILDGSTSGGILRVPIALAQNESTRDFLSGWGFRHERGIFVNVTSGTVRGTVFVVPMREVTQGDIKYAVAQGRSGEWSPVEAEG